MLSSSQLSTELLMSSCDPVAIDYEDELYELIERVFCI